ncbi:3' terminal RNA ribose 2'-O-methyltransferase Hen1 [Ideonella alba]|uniref:Small RNA 2'-O-methyltransferase n=1 Tax=Ideonella alba TaxID=2824118 RepID=A0A940YBE2_9BURK|nr:3' terminal RNA ribose 2'-O-methyltransferase Hen1 [Ideonella alba]MBQ0933442.1 3' terminal RNA ribose 2'-O-methyltransferase Hen1 [Ideonella alba]
MLLAITTTHRPATDLGYLLHKHPERVHSRRQSYGVAHVFFPEVSEERCTAALFVEVDPVGLVRDRKGTSASAALMDQYVNDRPYAASSLLSAAMADTLGSAMGGRSADRPELVGVPLPLVFSLPTLPCRGGERLLRALFEPLGYEVDARQLPLDERSPSWGASPYFSVQLRTTAPLHLALTHLYVLIPVLDNSKHYWVGEDEVDKLLARGEPWLGTHPQRDLIVRRYLKHRRSLADLAIDRLVVSDGSTAEDAATADGTDAPRGDEQEHRLERSLSLNERRLEAVAAVVESLQASSVIDLGCGEGRLLKQLLPMKGVVRLTGMDVSHRSLQLARERLNLDRQPQMLQDKLSWLHSSLVYRDARFAGYDLATLVEVIEHLDEPRLGMLSRVVFEFARPKAVVVTTPNVDYNARFPALPAGRMRHPDHRFEWTRPQFQAWAQQQADRFGYAVRFEGIGDADAHLGAPTQMAVFTLQP